MKKAILLFSALFVSTLLWSQTAVQPTGSGTEEDPYLIATLENLYWVSTYVNSGGSTLDVHFKQTANIDASPTVDWFGGEGWVPIGLSHNHRFTGHYNGNGKVITGLSINRPHENYLGLFGVIGNPSCAGGGAHIHNLGLINMAIKGAWCVGGLAGNVLGGSKGIPEQHTIIENCYVHGLLEGEALIGGIAGSSEWGVFTIRDCFNLAHVKAVLYGAGGIVGFGEIGSIKDSYSVGLIEGENPSWAFVRGGLVGQTPDWDGGKLRVINSYWDRAASGQEESAGGSGLDTETMKDPGFWIGTGWDFKGAGPEGVWNIGDDRNSGYPYLNWQYPDAPPMPSPS